MILRINGLVIGVAILFCSPLIRIGHSQQANRNAGGPNHRPCGFENTKGVADDVNGTLRFVHAKAMPTWYASIEDGHGKG